MASTYSNLKIQLMTTGENATTWGNVTNLNLGTALEEAIVGSADVTFASAAVTLTLTDTNSSQTARNMRLRCTGTTGGSTRNLVVPSIEKPYIVQNDCADSIVVKTSAGTGITVPAGKTMWVYSDATNVVDATSHLTSLTLGTALAVLQGGTGSNTASGARTNLGLGTIATQNSNAVTITGGSITGITDLAVADGGTGASTAGDARTNLGATTLGGNLFVITNPSAVTFPRFNADNTVSALDAPTFRTAIGAGTSSTTGTVTSVAGAGTVNGLTLTGTVTGSGSITLGGTLSGVSLTTQVSGTLPIGNGGTNATTAGDARTNLGATTVGGNMFTLTNPSAVTFPRFNADNTISALDAATFRSAIGAGTSSTTGTVTSVSFTGGIVSVATATTTPALTVAGTSGGIPYFSSATTWATSAALTANAIVVGGGAGAAPATVTTGTGVVTALGVNTGTAGAFVVNGGALGTPSSGTLTNCTFPTLNQNTTGSAATLTTARTLTIGSTGKTFNGSANVSWTLGEIGAAASGANTDITSLNNSTTINSVTIGYRSIPRSTTASTAAVGDVGKCIAVTAGITIPNSTFAAGDAVSIYNDSASSITITASVATLRLAGTAFTGNRTLAARGMATVWFNSATEAIISGSGVT